MHLPLWLWLERRFGISGAVFGYLVLLSWIVTPILLAMLYRKSRALERRVLELRDRLATQNRQQQVERLQRVRTERKPRRRR